MRSVPGHPRARVRRPGGAGCRDRRHAGLAGGDPLRRAGSDHRHGAADGASGGPAVRLEGRRYPFDGGSGCSTRRHGGRRRVQVRARARSQLGPAGAGRRRGVEACGRTSSRPSRCRSARATRRPAHPALPGAARSPLEKPTIFYVARRGAGRAPRAATASSSASAPVATVDHAGPDPVGGSLLVRELLPVHRRQRDGRPAFCPGSGF